MSHTSMRVSSFGFGVGPPRGLLGRTRPTATRKTTTLSPKVYLPHPINLRAVVGSIFRTNKALEDQRVVGAVPPRGLRGSAPGAITTHLITTQVCSKKRNCNTASWGYCKAV